LVTGIKRTINNRNKIKIDENIISALHFIKSFIKNNSPVLHTQIKKILL